MLLQENIHLSTLTTLKVGGRARYVCTCKSLEDVREAVALAKEHNLPFRVLGEGSNVLARDQEYDGVVICVRIPGIHYRDEGERVHVTAGAGVRWEALVDDIVAKGYWGIENLAGIPGLVGAAPVQNIGAYGAELKNLFVAAEVLDTQTGNLTKYSTTDCAFAYRDSVFKHNRSLIICSVTFSVSKVAAPKLGYGDLAELVRSGEAMTTSAQIAAQVRKVRARKFPDLTTHGTAGSFFKNPIVAAETFAGLSQKFGAIPSFPAENGQVKIPLAFILDKVLGLRGYREGSVYLFGNQPLVLVVDEGACAKDVDTFATVIAERVREATNISIEREVQTI